MNKFRCRMLLQWSHTRVARLTAKTSYPLEIAHSLLVSTKLILHLSIWSSIILWGWAFYQRFGWGHRTVTIFEQRLKTVQQTIASHFSTSRTGVDSWSQTPCRHCSKMAVRFVSFRHISFIRQFVQLEYFENKQICTMLQSLILQKLQQFYCHKDSCEWSRMEWNGIKQWRNLYRVSRQLWRFLKNCKEVLSINALHA